MRGLEDGAGGTSGRIYLIALEPEGQSFKRSHAVDSLYCLDHRDSISKIRFPGPGQPRAIAKGANRDHAWIREIGGCRRSSLSLRGSL